MHKYQIEITIRDTTRSTYVVAPFFAVSSSATAIATSSVFFILASLTGGLAVGAASLLLLMNVAKQAPAINKVTCVVIFHQFITK